MSQQQIQQIQQNSTNEPDGLIPEKSILNSKYICKRNVKILQRACPQWMKHMQESTSWTYLKYDTPKIHKQDARLDIGNHRYCIVGEVFKFNENYFNSDNDIGEASFISMDLSDWVDTLCMLEEEIRHDVEHVKKHKRDHKKLASRFNNQLAILAREIVEYELIGKTIT